MGGGPADHPGPVKVRSPPLATLPAWAPSPAALIGPPDGSTFVLMEVETPGAARSLGWKVHMRCANGYREGTRSMRRCVYRKQLGLGRY